jgi:hypothetical protein
MSEKLSQNSDPGCNALYAVGGVAALLTVLNGLAEIGITFLPGGGMASGPTSAVEWFDLFRSSAFMGLRNLGLLNIFFTVLSIPVTYALYAAHRRTHQAFAGLALLAALLGAAVFFATNRAFPMLALSRQYAAAAADVKRAALNAAGEAMLAVGQSHTPGTFLAFFLSTVAGIAISLVMLRGRLFHSSSAAVGIAGFSLLLVFEFTSDFAPGFPGTFALALGGGLLSLLWDLLVGLRFLQLARKSA